MMTQVAAVVVVVVVALLLATASSLPDVSAMDFTEQDLASEDSLRALYDRWSAHYSVSRDAADRARRFHVFAANARHVHEFNAKGDASYTLGLNHFADDDSAAACYRPASSSSPSPPSSTSSSSSPNKQQVNNVSSSDAELPRDVDWRMRRNGGRPGCVTDVKDQGRTRCGSCWAFSAAAALEGLNSILTDKLVSLSAQELIDCSSTWWPWGNKGCSGGNSARAFDYVKRANGLSTEADYPYAAQNGKCLRNPEGQAYPRGGIGGRETVRPSMDEAALMRAVAAQPVVAAVEGGGMDFKMYRAGIFTGPCGTNLSHQVAVIGYGTDYVETGGSGRDFWLIKNSWGDRWGEYGYMRLLRGGASAKEGTCGILMDAVYPIKHT
ncbi:hypothetical protein PR202_ga03736 [Eleusine coracana subsp. coracana]|uniref:Uncharacterized protein n=1 Tax=Eleusine coracana subsp. coracana TaxID=191504 RepID=A0AAV5BQK7_ELECO|nr:hypothetical protein PR202_ga03736 [Eleusine coracana subsp. coracana]